MKTLVAFFSATLLTGLVASAPVPEQAYKIVFTKETFSQFYKAYKGQHDIIDVVLPINSLDTDNELKNLYQVPTLFFVEADINENHEKEYKGLYVLNNGNPKKLLDQGTSIAAGFNNIKSIYFGTTEGIYIYNPNTNSAAKYGSLSDNIIDIAKETGTDAIYILTADHIVYRVTDKGNTKTKIESIKNAQQMVMDYKNNIYYIDENKNLYIYDGRYVKRVADLPENPSYIDLVRPNPAIKNRVGAMIDNKNYLIFSDGTVSLTEIDIAFRPTASDFTDSSIQYVAFDKKIYAFNALVTVFQNWIENVKKEQSL